MTELLDARGVAIAPGDTVIYGFGVGRSVAMAEAVVLGECVNPENDCGGREKVSLTPKGRVRLRVVRRSYSSGQKPIVDVAPDRLVVLKAEWTGLPGNEEMRPSLPPSPLPTQAEEARVKIERSLGYYTEALRDTVAPEFWVRDPASTEPEAHALGEYLAFCARELASLRRKLKDLDASA